MLINALSFKFWCTLFFHTLLFSPLLANKFAWPTANQSYLKNQSPENYIQPTISGKLISGYFGCVRAEGRQFHEGLDLKAIQLDQRGESTDEVFAFTAGKVVYINDVAWKSTYGKYVVIEHSSLNLPVYSLYAHLRSIDRALMVGTMVLSGQVIGILGRTASYPIPKSRAHLHWEIGIRYTNAFGDWYQAKKFKSPNYHGIWNGQNLGGIDPLAFFSFCQKEPSPKAFFNKLPRALTLRVSTSKVPDFCIRYPIMVIDDIIKNDLTGWEVSFTWNGVPVEWKPLYSQQHPLEKGGTIRIVRYEKELIETNQCRKLLSFSSGKPHATATLKNILQLLFGFN